jgi:hypothetical protein
MQVACINRKSLVSAIATALLIAFCLAPPLASAGSYKVLHSFCGKANCTDGGAPQGLVMDESGDIFGVSESGGSLGDGTIFELTRNGTGGYKFQTLYSFCIQANCADGKIPWGSLILDKQGNLYGVTWLGGPKGYGEVFELERNNRTRNLQVLYGFCSQVNCADGASPQGGLTYAGAASGMPYDGGSPLYGSTEGTGDHYRLGNVVYAIQPENDSWVEQVIHKSRNLRGSITMDVSGNLYTTAGSDDIELSPTGEKWNLAVLYSFCTGVNGVCQGDKNGTDPAGGVVMDLSGRLWGVTSEGGHQCHLPYYVGFGCGTIYSLDPGHEGYSEQV